MQVIPVIDLKGGQVVRGVAGRREEYRPIDSRLCPNAAPATVARAFAELGFQQIYVADLDAIEKVSGTFFAREESSDAWEGLKLLFDAGIGDVEQAVELGRIRVAGRPIDGIVTGLETLASPAVLGKILSRVGSQRVVFSLDLKAGIPLTQSAAWRGLSPLQIATLALRLGIRRMIVLDLARVGVGEGVGTERLCRELRCLDPELEIIAGGGVRGPGDLESLERAGCSGALVASALHDGRLTAAACAQRSSFC